ncbi:MULTISPECIES: HEAT repeat domain-containing protein [unclassified Streptomyces]|uniref:HEAT repeat domain-containing protein n=1 Tax=unclassified Streptomyces TaxID=2593676 RepID=UPI0006AED2B6|nr:MULTISPECIES: HEAT repeat domain-containing protein [unclassified Streptomyces]KOX33673.1 PBS lyase [Streptomyces sp. NRRL F-6491]KOX37142.1 PBS lyase [Streptomyces sp. NRRL F-6492]
MLTGIEEVDWASLGHAYGPADDVPELLRGLASADPAERETALDAMYGAVHHQGDVYDSTLACIPFLLELVADPGVQDRGCIVELLTSIGGIELDDDEEMGEHPCEDGGFVPAANYAMAAAAIAAGAGVFLGLVSDPDPEVRLAAPWALASLHPEPARVLTLLRERLTVERDTEVRLALVAAVGQIALRHASLRAETVDWLGWLARAAQDPGLRLAALAQRARCAPGEIPDDVVPWVTALLEEIRTASVPGAGPDTPRGAAPTLIGQVRELLEEHAAGRPAPWTEELLRTLHTALDDRVDDRIALVLAQLRSPDWGQRSDAIWLCGGLIRVWRGRYEEVVRLVGDQLQDPEPRLREAAASLLERLFELGAPAADALAARLASAPPGPAGGCGSAGRSGRDGALIALARAGDVRAVPLLARALEEGEVRRELLYATDGLGPSAAMLAPALRRRLARVELDELLYDRAAPLLYALAAVRGAQALPEVLRVLRGAPANRRDRVREAALRALAAFGPAAREAVPDLRGLLADESAAVSTAAARALWAAGEDPAEVLPVLERWLRPGLPDADRCAAARALGEIGRSAAAAAPALRPALVSRDLWVRVHAAAALWRTTGETEEALPVLLAAWEEDRHARVDIAECLAEMGPAASAAQLVVLTELTRRRRHNAREGASGTHDVHLDEKLLTLCRAALARMERGAY